MSQLDQRLERILLAIVRAYRVDSDAPREPLTHFRTAGGDEMQHPAWPTDGPAVGREDLEELSELGLVRIDYNRGAWSVRPTQDALEIVARYQRELARAERSETVDVSWGAVRPVLHALVAVWERNGAPTHASISVAAVARELDCESDDLALIRSLELLEEDAWIEADYELGTDGPLSARPLPKALAGTRGWPGADDQAAGERLINALDELAAREPDEDKRKKLSRVRDFALDLGSKTLSELGGKVAGGAL